MLNKKRNIFRQESLERLSSPERLDQLMQVVAPKDWLSLVALGFLVTLGVGWGIFGRISLTVAGRGVLIYPYRVIELQAPIAGQLQALNIERGRAIRKGDVLGAIEQQELRSQHSGQVLEVTAQPGQMLNVGTRLGAIATQQPSDQLVGLLYFSIPDGNQIRPGMTVQITPDSVKREQFGGILGRVKSVSTFPVTQQSVTNAIGNAEVAAGLLTTGGQIEVLTELELDSTTASGYQWSSSKGPELRFPPGTTTSVRVTVDQQAPISLILPILKAATGVD